MNIPSNKRVIIALTYIHGIGPAKAKAIAAKVGIEEARRVQDLTDSVNVRQRDNHALVRGDVHPGNTSQLTSPCSTGASQLPGGPHLIA